MPTTEPIDASEPHTVRPRVVSIAATILGLNVLLWLVDDLVRFQGGSAFPKDQEWLMVCVVAVAAAVEALLIGLIARGAGWARYAYALIVLLSWAGYLFSAEQLPESTGLAWDEVLGWLSLGLQTTALALTFIKPAARWFNRRLPSTGRANSEEMR